MLKVILFMSKNRLSLFFLCNCIFCRWLDSENNALIIPEMKIGEGDNACRVRSVRFIMSVLSDQHRSGRKGKKYSRGSGGIKHSAADRRELCCSCAYLIQPRRGKAQDLSGSQHL